MYKLTKLQALNEEQEKERVELNDKLAEELANLGFISGGSFLVTTGDVYEGTFEEEPTVGMPFYLDKHIGSWVRTSLVQEVTKESDDVTIIKTMNSIYKLEKIHS